MPASNPGLLSWAVFPGNARRTPAVAGEGGDATMTASAGDDHPGRKPSRAALARGLARLFATEVPGRGPPRITWRRASPRTSTYLADIVHVRFADGSRERLLCKYADGVGPPLPHRGLDYEADVYEHVLRQCPVPTPHAWGRFTDERSGGSTLVLRFYPDALSAAQAVEEGGVTAAAEWLARFHAWGADRVTAAGWRFLTRYDEAYYRLWIDRTCELARPLAGDYPWLDRAAAAYRDRIPLLCDRTPTCIHGEYTTRNCLWHDGLLLPVDWETAAIGPAEIDLAVFTYDWDPEDVEVIVAAYVARRWGGTPPAAFAETLFAARLYVSLHWIFSRMSGREEPRVRDHLEGFYEEALRLGIVAAD